MKAQRFIPYVLMSIIGIGLLGSSVGFAAVSDPVRYPISTSTAPIANQGGGTITPVTNQAGTIAPIANQGGGTITPVVNQAGTMTPVANTGNQVGSTAPIAVTPTAGRVIVKDPYYPTKVIKPRQ